MQKSLLFSCLVLVPVVLLNSSFAQSTPPNPNESSLGEMVVTATRYPENVSTIPAHVTVITREDIDSSTARTVPDLLRTEAGIQVNDIAGNRRSVTVDLRGFGETANLNTVALVDGRRINQADLSGIDWTQIPLDRIERIEIIRGGREAVLYGDNAGGGVINIITKEGQEFSAAAGVAGGSYSTFQAGGDLSGTSGDLGYAFSGAYLTSDGYRDNSDVEAGDLGLNLNYYPKDNIRLTLSGGYHDEDVRLPGALKDSDFAAGASRTDTVQPDDFADTQDYYVKAGGEVTFWGDSIARADVSYRQRDFLSFASFDGGNFRGDTEIDTVTVSPQVVINRPVGTFPNTLTAGYDYVRAQEDITNVSEFFGEVTTGVFDLEKENHGLYLHDSLRVVPDLLLSAGYRYDKADFSFDPSSPGTAGLHENLYTAGANYTLPGGSFVYASYSRSFRYPVLDELFSFFTNTVVPDLKNQQADDYEAGLRYYFAGENYVQTGIFRSETDDEIFYNPASYANENLDGTAERTGVELSFGLKPHERVMVSGSYTHLTAEIDGGQFDGKDLPGVAEHKATLGTTVDIGYGLSVAVNAFYVGKRRFISDFANSFEYQDDYLVVNTRCVYRRDRYTAYVNVNNITDEEYAEYGVLGGFPTERAYYPSPGINVLAGLSVSF